MIVDDAIIGQTGASIRIRIKTSRIVFFKAGKRIGQTGASIRIRIKTGRVVTFSFVNIVSDRCIH